MNNIDFVSLIMNLQREVATNSNLMRLIVAVCYFMALVFALIAMFQLKEVADQQRHTFKAPLFTFLAAILMAGAPSMIATVFATTYGGGWDQSSPLAYVKNPGGSGKFIHALLSLVSFVGYVFFVRGIWILKEAGEPQRYSQSTVGKALVVMFAGMAAIYIDFTLKVIGNTFGMNFNAYLN